MNNRLKRGLMFPLYVFFFIYVHASFYYNFAQLAPLRIVPYHISINTMQTTLFHGWAFLYFQACIQLVELVLGE